MAHRAARVQIWYIGIIAAYKQEQYQAKGITEENFADASRMAVEVMIADIKSALN